MPSTAEAEARRRGGVKGYRTVKRGDRTFLVAIVPEAGPRGGHTVAMTGPVAAPTKKVSRKKLRRVAKKRKARDTRPVK